MNTELYEFDSIEKKQRNHWRLATIYFLGVYPAITLLVTILSNDSSPDNPFHESLIIGSIALAVRLGLISMLLRSAYKQRRTALLTCCLILAFVNCINSIPRLLSTSDDPWILADILINLGMYAWWCIASLKLLRINKRIKTQKQQCPEYLKHIEELKTAITIEELDTRFARLMTCWPELEPRSYKEYKTKKSEFLKTQ